MSGGGRARKTATLAGPVASLLLEGLFRGLLVVSWPLLRLLVLVRREGPPLPKGAVVVAPNHCSFMDPVVMQMASWRHLSFMMTEVYYNPIPFRWMFQILRAIPVREGRANRNALEVAEEALRRGWAVCIFPEGGIARDGVLQDFQPGVAAIAAAAQAPVVPVALLGTFETFPRHAKFPGLFRAIVVRFGAPIPPPPRIEDDAARREALRAYAAQVRGEVERLQRGADGSRTGS